MKAVNWTELVYNLVVPQHVTILTHMWIKNLKIVASKNVFSIV